MADWLMVVALNVSLVATGVLTGLLLRRFGQGRGQ